MNRRMTKKIIRYLETLIRKQNILQSTMLDICNRITNLENTRAVPQIDNVDSIFIVVENLPANTTADLESLKIYLGNEMNNAVKEISKLGGATIYEFMGQTEEECFPYNVPVGDFNRLTDAELKLIAEHLLDNDAENEVECKIDLEDEMKCEDNYINDDPTKFTTANPLSNFKSMKAIPKIKLNNGTDIPVLGLGTWQSNPGAVRQAVEDAIDIGYRHIDCAHIYGNQTEIGEALTAKISQGVVSRQDLFITSKLWNTFHRPGTVEPILRSNLKDMNLEYFDLYLIHWPTGFKEGDSLSPMGPDGIEYSEYDYVDTWKAMEDIYKKGLAKAIGISNFNKHQIERVLEIATVKPVINQVECHPYLNQNQLIEFCKSKEIVVTAYSPLGSPGREEASKQPKVLNDSKLKDIAKKYGKSVAQIALKYQIQREVVAIPKSITKKRLEENLNIFDFTISDEDMKAISWLNKDFRYVGFEEIRSHRFYPFTDEY
ncbi:hypothetical protein RN001_005937 [Aquatica leii]|uniref:NADP-dependent oxidoreductase domain-containing protein n=1 Tax=Aquatica leii TaxID=1421715 RepID=A0AAN7QKN5_9COLE|nr:hypothetical protein RN001_005937 [Aquatica leii]